MTELKEKETKMINCPIPAELHERLRHAAFVNRTSMTNICREGIEKILKEKYKL